MAEEQRKHPRVESLSLSYICMDDGGNTFEQCIMGRTLNVSESGICLETHCEIETVSSLRMTIALEEEEVELAGEIVYCRPGKNEMFETGVQFTELDDKHRVIYQQYVDKWEGKK